MDHEQKPKSRTDNGYTNMAFRTTDSGMCSRTIYSSFKRTQMTHNFQNVAVKCQTWKQMLHLAELAEMQGYERLPLYLDEDDFNDGHTLFAVNDLGFIGNWCKTNVPIIPYTTFITPPVGDSVYGC